MDSGYRPLLKQLLPIMYNHLNHLLDDVFLQGSPPPQHNSSVIECSQRASIKAISLRLENVKIFFLKSTSELTL